MTGGASRGFSDKGFVIHDSMPVEAHTVLMSGNLVRWGGALYIWVGIVRARFRRGSGPGPSDSLVRSMIVRVSLGNVLERGAGGAVWRLVS